MYKATDTVLGRVVAIKSLSNTLVSQPTFLDRFKNEAKTLAKLTHPNIAVLYNYLQNESEFYMIMEYVEGENLDQLLAHWKTLSYQTVVPVMVQALEGLAHAHSKGVLHRDIKPANLMLTPENVVKLMDFGIARVSDQAKLTQVSRVIGTLEFLAPEIIEGQEATPTSDIYAAGVVMYELLTGKLPFSGKSDYMLMQEIVKTKPVFPDSLDKNIPQQLSEIVLKALEKNPENRYATASEFSKALQDAYPDLKQIPSGLLLSKVVSDNDHQGASVPEAFRSVPSKAAAPTTVLHQPIPPTTVLTREQPPKNSMPSFLKSKILYLGVAALLIVLFTLFKVLSPTSENVTSDEPAMLSENTTASDQENSQISENVEEKVNNDSINFLLIKKKQEEALLAEQQNNNENKKPASSKKPDRKPASQNGDNAGTVKPGSDESDPQRKPKPTEEAEDDNIGVASGPINLRGRGIPISIALRENLTKETANEGQHISFRVTEAGRLKDKVIVPAGSVIHGTIKGLGSRRMSIVFNSVSTGGRNMRLERSEIGASMETVFSGKSFKTGLRGILTR